MVLVSAYLFAAENSPLQLGVAAAISTATASSSPQLLALKKFSTCFFLFALMHQHNGSRLFIA